MLDHQVDRVFQQVNPLDGHPGVETETELMNPPLTSHPVPRQPSTMLDRQFHEPPKSLSHLVPGEDNSDEAVGDDDDDGDDRPLGACPRARASMSRYFWTCLFPEDQSIGTGTKERMPRWMTCMSTSALERASWRWSPSLPLLLRNRQAAPWCVQTSSESSRRKTFLRPPSLRAS